MKTIVLKIITFFLFIFYFTPLPAQEKDCIDSLRSENSALKRSLADSTKRIVVLSKELAKLESSLKDQKDANMKMETKKAEIVKPYKEEILVLKDTIARLQEDMSKLRESESRSRSDLESVKQELDAVRLFRQMYVKTKVEEEKPYIQLPYSEMDSRHLQEVIDLCIQFDDPVLNDLAGEFSSAIDRKAVYDSFVESVNAPFDQKLIDSLLCKKELILKSSNAIQKEKVDFILMLMESYKESNEVFLKMIKQINGYMLNYRQEGTDLSVARDWAEYILKSQKIEFYYNNFSKIPYLLKLFTDFKSELLSNPVSEGKIEHEALNIKVL